MIQDIEDNYTEYLGDTRGYTWDAWDVLDPSAIFRHDELLASTPATLAAVDIAGLDDLERWAYARVHYTAGDVGTYLDAGRLVIDEPREHRGIAYDEVLEAMIESLTLHGEADEAELLLEKFGGLWPEDSRAIRLRVWVATHTPSVDAALDAATDALRADPERLFEIAEDLAGRGDTARAMQTLVHVEAFAAAQGTSALLLDVALLRANLLDDDAGVDNHRLSGE